MPATLKTASVKPPTSTLRAVPTGTSAVLHNSTRSGMTIRRLTSIGGLSTNDGACLDIHLARPVLRAGSREIDREVSMLHKEQNDLLTQTGPGKPMGRLFRCYW